MENKNSWKKLEKYNEKENPAEKKKQLHLNFWKKTSEIKNNWIKNIVKNEQSNTLKNYIENNH